MAQLSPHVLKVRFLDRLMTLLAQSFLALLDPLQLYRKCKEWNYQGEQHSTPSKRMEKMFHSQFHQCQKDRGKMLRIELD